MSTKDVRTTGTTRKTSELLIVTKNELGSLARITAPLAKNRINIECFSGYEWGTEAAFRLVTDNNRKAGELLKNEGFSVQETPVVLWQTGSTPGKLHDATVALAEARVNTYSSYSTTLTGTREATAVLNTSDATKTMEVLKRI